MIFNFYKNTHTGTLKSILTNLRGRLSESISHIPIRRDYVLTDALRTVKRASFCYSNKIMVHNNDKCILLSIIINLTKVEFLGEVRADGGGPGREFWCCLAKDIQQSLCEGTDENKVFRHNAVALQVSMHVHQCMCSMKHFYCFF